MKKTLSGFTLLELMVVVAIIWILAIWASNIQFNPQIDKQNSLLFSNDIFTNIEKVRNNALFWKWVWSWSTLTYPEKWIINLDTNWNGSISAKYSSWWTIYNYNDFRVDFLNQNSKISQLKCLSIDNLNSETWSYVDIEISKNNITLSWCSSPNDKILEITTNYKAFTNTIKLNTVSWLLEKSQK